MVPKYTRFDGFFSQSILMGGAKYVKTRANKAINAYARAV